MKSEEKISVIVPIYNVEPYLRRCLDSLVGQTHQNLEIILVDDGSPDGCGAICDEYAAKDERIIVIHKANGGVSSARNAGLEQATGDWIGWVDPDDWIQADMFEYLLKNAKKYNADIAVCGLCKVYSDHQERFAVEEVTQLDNVQGMETLLENDLLQSYCCDKLWRRELWQGIVFPLGKTFEDMCMVPLAFQRARKTVLLPEAKYFYRQHHESIVASTSLSNKLNHCAAADYRYETLRTDYPQLEPLLLDQRMASAVGVWTSYYRNPRAVRRAALPQIREIAAFCREHKGLHQTQKRFGLAGRLMMKLLPYPSWWAFLLARVVSDLYKYRHGDPL